jgi:chemotaxis signal transduction protein
VFDARQLLSLPPAPAEVKDPILLVLGEGHPVGGTLVDGVEGILSLPSARFHSTPQGSARGELVRALGPDGLALLDGGRIVSSLS